MSPWLETALVTGGVVAIVALFGVVTSWYAAVVLLLLIVGIDWALRKSLDGFGRWS